MLNKNLPPRFFKEVIDILSGLHPLCDKNIAFKLMQPNVILAIAGIKPFADISEISPQDKTLDKIDILNSYLDPFGLHFEIYRPKGTNKIYGGFKSLYGLERITHMSAFPFIEGFDWNKESYLEDAFIHWKNRMQLELKKLVDKKEYTLEEVDTIGQGLLMGYPDQAILDLIEYYRLPKESKINIPFYMRYLKDNRSTTLADRVKGKEIFIESQINIPEEYKDTSPLPLFTYKYSNKADEGINIWIKYANDTLDSFYNSHWYKTHRII